MMKINPCLKCPQLSKACAYFAISVIAVSALASTILGSISLAAAYGLIGWGAFAYVGPVLSWIMFGGGVGILLLFAVASVGCSVLACRKCCRRSNSHTPISHTPISHTPITQNTYNYRPYHNSSSSEDTVAAHPVRDRSSSDEYETASEPEEDDPIWNNSGFLDRAEEFTAPILTSYQSLEKAANTIASYWPNLGNNPKTWLEADNELMFTAWIVIWVLEGDFSENALKPILTQEAQNEKTFLTFHKLKEKILSMHNNSELDKEKFIEKLVHAKACFLWDERKDSLWSDNDRPEKRNFIQGLILKGWSLLGVSVQETIDLRLGKDDNQKTTINLDMQLVPFEVEKKDIDDVFELCDRFSLKKIGKNTFVSNDWTQAKKTEATMRLQEREKQQQISANAGIPEDIIMQMPVEILLMTQVIDDIVAKFRKIDRSYNPTEAEPEEFFFFSCLITLKLLEEGKITQEKYECIARSTNNYHDFLQAQESLKSLKKLYPNFILNHLILQFAKDQELDEELQNALNKVNKEEAEESKDIQSVSIEIEQVINAIKLFACYLSNEKPGLNMLNFALYITPPPQTIEEEV